MNVLRKLCATFVVLLMVIVMEAVELPKNAASTSDGRGNASSLASTSSTQIEKIASVTPAGNATVNKTTGDSTHSSREGVVNEPDVSNDKNKTATVDKTDVKGRKGVVDEPNVPNLHKNNSTTSPPARQNASVDTTKPVSEQTDVGKFEDSFPKVTQTDEEKNSKPRKGVVNNNSSSTATSSTTTTTKRPTSTTKKVVTKPHFTEHYEGPMPDAVQEVDITVHTDHLLEKKSNQSDYIVPIVAVILSVPLVAIIASILYKKGTDWYQHRNYRRMDFLIEGMYNN